MELFKMGNVDFSSNITVPNYKVNREVTFNSYEDCDYINHKFIKRKKVSGEFSLKFFSLDDITISGTVVHGYRTFIDTYNSSRNSDGSHDITVLINNELISYSGNFDVTFKAKNDIPLYGFKNTEPITVTIEER